MRGERSLLVQSQHGTGEGERAWAAARLVPALLVVLAMMATVLPTPPAAAMPAAVELGATPECSRLLDRMIDVQRCGQVLDQQLLSAVKDGSTAAAVIAPASAVELDAVATALPIDAEPAPTATAEPTPSEPRPRSTGDGA